MPIKDIMDAGEVAEVLCISSTAVHRLASRGTLPSEWAGSKRVWRGATVRRYLDDAKAQARRRGGGGQGNLFLGDVAVSLDDTLAALKAQAPAGFDPVGKRKGHSK